ncbi:MAG: hypothetical protein WCG29_11150 [Desulfomonile sp.]
MEPLSRRPKTFPATLTTKTSPVPQSTINSTGTLESEHLQHAGDRCRPSGDVTDLLSRLILGCRDAWDTKRALPSINILVASSGEMLTDEAIPSNGKGYGQQYGQQRQGMGFSLL